LRHRNTLFQEATMAQAFDTLQQDAAVEVEKVGVIMGFLLGLVLAIGLINETGMMTEASTWVSVLAVSAIVAVCTRTGLALSRAFSRG
jgi:nitrate reductase gamma subunit